MSITVVETDVYAEAADQLFTLKERDAVRSHLAEHPQAGDVVPGLAGLRKLRWTEARRNKGRRGGTRHIYFYAVSDRLIVLLDAYSKGQKEDLSNADRKELRKALDILKGQLQSLRPDDQAGKKAR